MSRAFEGLGVTAAVVFVFLVVSRLIKGGALSLAEFIEKHYILIGIILVLIITSICIVIARSIKDLSMGNKVINCIACGIALSQNACFLVYGLYRAITVYRNDAFLTVLGVGGFILFYIIDLAVTAGGIVISVNKTWGAVILLIIAVLGWSLVIGW